MTEQERVQQLKTEGYDEVYTWTAIPKEDDPDHEHPFDSKLVILEGELEVTIDGKTTHLKVNDSIEVKRGIKHSALAGEKGCKYIVAEKH